MLQANAVGGRGNSLSTAVPSIAPLDSEGLFHLKVELAEALRAKGQFQSRLKNSEDSRDELSVRVKANEKLIKQLQAERSILSVKVRDRDEELRGKAQLLVVSTILLSFLLVVVSPAMQEVQDENMSLNLQLNVAEQQSAKLRRENKDLVDRWMARMGREADAMNDKLTF